MSAPARRAPDATAFALLIGLCALWGLQGVAVKVALPSIPPLAQAALRSTLAALLLAAWCALRGRPLLQRDGTARAGLLAGALFAGEFLFVYLGLAHTTAARLIVFLYLAPVLTALGLVWLVPGETLRGLQWLGVALAFGGIVVAFGDGLSAGAGGATLLGDVCGLIAAVLWAATTVWIRASRLSDAPAEKTLMYQLAVSAPLLAGASVIAGEAFATVIAPLAWWSVLYQGVLVAFASYLAWFWMLTRYWAARIAVFSFLTPLYGVLFGVWLLGEQLTPAFGVAAAMVVAGIGLVNARA